MFVPAFQADQPAHLLLGLSGHRAGVNDSQIALVGHYGKPGFGKGGGHTIAFGLVEFAPKRME
jgi:hypothetical protein